MKTLKYIAASLLLLLAAGCFEDKTTLDTVRISEIAIDTLKLQKIYNVDQNELLVIPIQDVVSENNEQLPLSYQWEVDYKLYSEEADLQFSSPKIGSFPARLKVSNEHGSSFYNFTINVNTAYSTGIAILSKDKAGKPMLSFMRELSDNEITAGKDKQFVTNCLEVNNPDVDFPMNPTDLALRAQQLYISFAGTPSIYMLNGQMLNVENIVTDSDPDFVPERIIMASSAAREAIITTPSGKVYKLASLEGVILPYSSFPSTYDSRIGLVASTGYQDAQILWDTKDKSICDLYGGWYFYDTQSEGLDFSGHTPVALYDRDGKNFTMLTCKDNVFMKTSIDYTWKIREYDDNWNLISERFGISDNQKVVAGSPKLTADSPYAANQLHQCLYYADGNKIYRWYFNSPEFPSTPWRTIEGLENAQITVLTVSPDKQQLYVGVTETGKSELSGSFYILNSDTGKDEEAFPLPARCRKAHQNHLQKIT